MKCGADQVIRGLMNYADMEVINKLPTMGKWIVGTGIGVLSDKASDIIINLQGSELLRMLGIVDDDGMFDVDDIMHHMKDSADKYGKAYIDIPVIGKMSFSSADIDTIKNYISRT